MKPLARALLRLALVVLVLACIACLFLIERRQPSPELETFKALDFLER